MPFLERALRIGESKQFKTFEKRVERINAYEPELELLEDADLPQRTADLRERAPGGLRQGARELAGAPRGREDLDDLLHECFALVREAGKRSMGMRHFVVQLIGGMVLHGGSTAGMRTGEGKTLPAPLPVVLNSLGGNGVHVVTVNDYLARRDAEWMSP